MTPKALVIDDDPDILDAVTDILESLGYECDLADSVESARKCLDGNEYTYMLLDLEIPVRAGRNLPRIQNGENLLEEIIQRCGTQRKPIIVMTAHGTDGPDLAVEVMKKGAVDYVTKPFKTVGRTLDKSIREALARLDEKSLTPPQPQVEVQPSETKSARATWASTFSGGTMIFHPDRVELCGTDICSGPRSERRRKALDLLRVRRKDREFECYSGEQFAQKLGLNTGQNGAAGMIRDLRHLIREALREQANIDCRDEDVILSGGPGYRLSGNISVQEGDDADRTRMQGHDTASVDQADAVRGTVRDPVTGTDDPVNARRRWILHQLGEGRKLRAPHIAKELKCSLRTVKRDLDALDNRVEFVGPARTGCYRLREPRDSER